MNEWMNENIVIIILIGATCYLNSLLQALFHIPVFRRAVYQMPAGKNSEANPTIPSALQKLFYDLQFSNQVNFFFKKKTWMNLKKKNKNELINFL